MKMCYLYTQLILFCFIDSFMDCDNLAIVSLYISRVTWISSEDCLEIQKINLIEMQRLENPWEG